MLSDEAHEKLVEEAKRIGKEALTHTNFCTALQSGLEKAYEEGAFDERERLRKELEEYKDDSVVAKLLLEKFQEQ